MESIMNITNIGKKEWRNENGELHREIGPAVIWPGGQKEWWLNGKLHRKDGPAIIHPNGYKEWLLNGLRHREDGPAIIYPNRYEEWFLNGIKYAEKQYREEIRKCKLSKLKFKTMESKMTVNELGAKEWRNEKGHLHQENGPARIWPNGHKEWYLNNKLHREDGPATIWPNGINEWYLNGKRHRENGPAIVYPDGQKEWWLNNIEYSKTQYQEEIRRRKLSILKL